MGLEFFFFFGSCQLLLNSALCNMHTPVVYPHLFSIRFCFDYCVQTLYVEKCGEVAECNF